MKFVDDDDDLLTYLLSIFISPPANKTCNITKKYVLQMQANAHHANSTSRIMAT